MLPYNVPAATQVAGTIALEFATEMKSRVHRLIAERERVERELRSTNGVTCVPSGANFVLFRVHGNGHALWSELVARGVLVRDFSRWPRLTDCLRVTIGTPEENDAFLGALRESLQEVAA